MSIQTVDQLAARLETIEVETAIAKKLWESLLPIEVPDDKQFALWLRLHSLDVVAYGLDETAKKFRRVNGMSLDHAIRFCSACMNGREPHGYAKQKSACVKSSDK